MEKNKSIDGLVSRRPQKKSTPKTTSQPVQKQSSPKTSSKKSISNQPNKTSKSSPRPSNESANILDINSTDDFLKPIQTFDFDAKSGELKPPEPTIEDSPERKKMKKSKKPLSKKRKIVIGVISFLLILIIGAVIWFFIWGNNLLSNITNGQGNLVDLITETYDPLKTDSNGRTNILAFGTSGYDMAGSEGDNIHDGAQLTDSIMVISLDQQTGDIAMLSLPRDLKASPTCTATGKINEVYWCNNQDGDNEQAGAEALMSEVEDILGIELQYYVHLNWGSLIQIVDILGGISVTLDEDIEDYYYTGAVYSAGVEYTLNGGEALGLARARHGTASGDFSRGASQQKILIGIKDKLLSKQLSISEIINLASTLGDNLRSNFSVNELKTLAHYTSSLDLNSMRQISLIEPVAYVTNSNIGGISYVIPSAGVGVYDDIQTYVAKMFSSDPRKYEESSILVLNGSETPGIASSEKETLIEEGYSNIYTDDAPIESTEKYTLYYLSDTAPGTKKLLEEKYHTAALTASELPAGIITECDFVLILGTENPTTE